MSNEHHALKLSQFAGKPDAGRLRKEMLELARDLVATDGIPPAVLLWLYDKAKHCLHLDHHLPETNPLFATRVGFAESLLENSNHVANVIRSNTKVAEWMAANGGPQLSLFRIASDTETMGYLCYSSHSTITESPILQGLCNAIAARIIRHRDKRKLKISQGLLDINWNEKTTVGEWLQRTAVITRDELNAELIVVFQLNADLNLEIVAGTADWRHLEGQAIAQPLSLVNRVYQQGNSIRILDHADVSERIRDFGTRVHDEELVRTLEVMMGGKKLRSWMAGSINYGRDPIAVLFAANKIPDRYFPSVFSSTDFELFKSVCSLAGNTMPRVKLFVAMQNISGAMFHEPAKSSSSASVSSSIPHVRNRIQAVIQAAQREIPGSICMGLGFRDHPGSKYIESESILYGGSDIEHQILINRMNGPWTRETPVPYKLGEGFWISEYHLPSVPNRTATLSVLLRRAKLPQHTNEILNYTRMDIEQMARDLEALHRHEREWIEFRHAIRSGLQGLGHLDNAVETYDLMADGILTISDLQKGQLRKSLHWARQFAVRTRHLVEEIRFLIETIQRDQLRIGDCNVNEITRETIRCLDPDAQRRAIEVHFNNLRLQDDPVGDRQLIEIAIFNIVDNAIKYSFRGKPIHINLSQRGRSWELSVTDTGVFIPPQDYDIIFEPRVRRPSGQAHRTRPGTGLGLTVSKQIIEAHGGKISVKSIASRSTQEGATTTFTILCPIKP